MTTTCTVCGQDATGSEARTLTLFNSKLEISAPGRNIFTALDDERACSCGQTCALVLAERCLERSTFAPAEFHHDVDRSTAQQLCGCPLCVPAAYLASSYR